MAILLIRHGETPSNAARVIQTPETPLSERGREQAERLARRLRGEGVAHILSSDLSRAVMTSEALRAATGARLELEPLLQERNFGDLRGTPYAELAQDLFGPQFDPPGGESWEVFHRRVDTAWDRVREIAAGTSGNLAVVTHGLQWRTFLEGDEFMFPEEGWELFQSPRCHLQLLIPIQMGAVWEYPWAEAEPIIKECVDRVGADRLIYGTDMPMVARFCTYRQTLDQFRTHCDFLSPTERNDILGGTAARVMGIE